MCLKQDGAHLSINCFHAPWRAGTNPQAPIGALDNKQANAEANNNKITNKHVYIHLPTHKHTHMHTPTHTDGTQPGLYRGLLQSLLLAAYAFLLTCLLNSTS